MTPSPKPLDREGWDKRLNQIDARCEAATTGPWKLCDASDAFDNWPICPSLGSDDDGNEWAVSTDGIRASEMNGGNPADDAEFIAHARQDVPDLVAYCRALQSEVERLNNRVKFLTGDRGFNIQTILTEEEKKKRFYAVRCAQCGFVGTSEMLRGGEPIPEAGDYDDTYCPHCGSVEIDEIQDIAPQEPSEIVAFNEKAIQDYCEEMERKYPPEDPDEIEKARQPK